MKEMLRMILVLSLICGLSGLTLATVRQATSERIEEQVLTYVQGPASSRFLQTMTTTRSRIEKPLICQTAQLPYSLPLKMVN